MIGKRRDVTKKAAQSSCKSEVTKKVINDLSVRIYCETIECPNRCQCISQGLATFLIMGDICTRRCDSVCISKQGKPLPLDPNEPNNIAQAAKLLNLNHVVLTSVTRDDLNDGGASHIAKAVTALHEINPCTTVEVIIHNSPNSIKSTKTIVESSPEVLCHEIKTVPRLNPILFENSGYRKSIDFLEIVKSLNPSIVTKSGLMLGLGENDYEVINLLSDVHDTGCNCITLGQYLPPSSQHHQLDRHVSTREFEEYQNLSIQIGYDSVRSGPFVRSSFDAAVMYKEVAE